ncbi:MAG TPA: hypothetical protein VH496_07640 [Mycobacterium sp.]|jgi:hypothetical protein
MASPTTDDSCFLAEWYGAELAGAPVEPTAATLRDAAAAVSSAGTPVHLLAILAIPTDAVLFAVFSAASAQIVTQTCDRAGMLAQRLTPAGVHFSEP